MTVREAPRHRAGSTDALLGALVNHRTLAAALVLTVTALTGCGSQQATSPRSCTQTFLEARPSPAGDNLDFCTDNGRRVPIARATYPCADGNKLDVLFKLDGTPLGWRRFGVIHTGDADHATYTACTP